MEKALTRVNEQAGVEFFCDPAAQFKDLHTLVVVLCHFNRPLHEGLCEA